MPIPQLKQLSQHHYSTKTPQTVVKPRTLIAVARAAVGKEHYQQQNNSYTSTNTSNSRTTTTITMKPPPAAPPSAVVTNATGTA